MRFGGVIRGVGGAAIGMGVMAAISLAGGCTSWWPAGGPMSSEDRYIYTSTEWMPWTVNVVDTVSNQVVWSKEVPVGAKLVMRFHDPLPSEDLQSPSTEYPVRLEWDLWPADKEWGDPQQIAWVTKSRRLDPILRPVPEAPDELGPALGTPTSETPNVGERPPRK